MEVVRYFAMPTPNRLHAQMSEEEVGEVVGSPPPTLKNAYVKLRRGVSVRPLELLVAEGKDGRKVIMRVVNLQHCNPYETATSIDVEEKSGISAIPFSGDMASVLPGVYILAETDIVECYKIRNGRAVPLGRTEPPVPGSSVYKASDEVIDVIVGTPRYPIEVGYLAGTDNVVFKIDANAFMRHCLIVGNPGTGKSYFRGILMEKLLDIGARQVNFDPLDEYYYTVEDLGGENIIIGRDYRPRLDVLSEGEFTNLIEPYIPTEFQRAIAREGFKRFVQVCRIAGRPLDPSRLIRYVEDAANDMQAGDDTRINVVERLRTLLNSLGIVGTGGRDLARIIESKRLANFVFRDVGELHITFSVASILKEILTLKRANRIGNLIVSTDEAHLLVPSGKTNPPSKGVIKRLIRYGRHYGIGVMLITQLPASLDQEVVSLPSIRVFFATSTDQIRGVSYLLSDLPRSVLEDLPRLERGTAIITGAKDLIRHSAYVRIFSERRSRHGAPTPPLVGPNSGPEGSRLGGR